MNPIKIPTLRIPRFMPFIASPDDINSKDSGRWTPPPPKFFKNFQLCKLSYYGANDAPPPTPPALSRKDEKAAFMRFHVRRTAKTREILVRHYLCWAFKMAAKFKGPRLDFDEAVSVANLGLMEALENYDPTLGYRFTTYAAFVLRRKLIEAIVNTYPVRVSDHTRKKWRLLDLDPASLAIKQIGDEPRTFAEFFERLGETSDVDIALMHERPEDSPFMPAPSGSPADLVEESGLSEDVRAAVKVLPPLEKAVILARYFAEKPESYESIGRRLHVSKTSAREAYETALVRLRTQFKK